MKKLLFLILTVTVLASCSDITDMNKDPKRPADVNGETLFSNAQKELGDFLSSTNVNTNIFKLVSQYWTETTYTDEANYDLTGRQIPSNDWSILYRNVLKDLDQSSKLIADDNTIPAGVKQNEQACIEIMKVLTYSELVNIWGDVPYTEALNIDNTLPKYDDGMTIYKDLVKRLDAAKNKMDTTNDGFGSADLIYGGSSDPINQWIKFANSIKLRMGITIADVDAQTAQKWIQEAAPNAFTSNDDNALILYKSYPPDTNPLWEDLVQSGRHDFVAANTAVDTMNALKDPRIGEYFTTKPDTSAYIGGVYAASNSYFDFSHPGEKVTDPTFPGIYMQYSEVEFIKAEAVERGFLNGSAEQHYNNGIRASMEYWGVDNADIQSYMNQSDVAYNSAPGDYKAKIGLQKWLALYLQGLQAWTEYRRLDNPTMNARPGNSAPDVPTRFTYPIKEQNVNTAQYNKASDAIGGDDVSTKLFWDVN